MQLPSLQTILLAALALKVGGSVANCVGKRKFPGARSLRGNSACSNAGTKIVRTLTTTPVRTLTHFFLFQISCAAEGGSDPATKYRAKLTDCVNTSCICEDGQPISA